MRAWYFESRRRIWIEIEGATELGVRLARRLGYRVAFGKGKK